MLPNWNERLARVIEDLCSKAQCDLSDSPFAQGCRQVALETRALPVYCDLGGWLVITSGGSILHYDVNLGEPAERWKRLALVMAADRYPELEELRPVRPEGARTCHHCNGNGKIRGCPCATCCAAGWLT